MTRYYWLLIRDEWVPAGYNEEADYWYVPGRIATNGEIESYGPEIDHEPPSQVTVECCRCHKIIAPGEEREYCGRIYCQPCKAFEDEVDDECA